MRSSKKHYSFRFHQDNTVYAVRQARKSDASFVQRAYEDAKSFLASQAIDQWQDGYPNRESFLQDLEHSRSYVLEQFLDSENDFFPIASFSLQNIDTSYEAAAFRNWKFPDAYIAIHRLALAKEYRRKGLSILVFHFTAKKAIEESKKSVRIDTHEKNMAMRLALAKAGFDCRGSIQFRREIDAKVLDRLAYDATCEEILTKTKQFIVDLE